MRALYACFLVAPLAVFACTKNDTASGLGPASDDFQTLHVKITGTGKGTVMADPVDRDRIGSTTADADLNYADLTTVKLTANAGAGSTFTGWDTGSDPGCASGMVMNTARTCIARFDTGTPLPDGGPGTTGGPDAGDDAGKDSGGAVSNSIIVTDTMNRFAPITLDSYTCKVGSPNELVAPLPPLFAAAVGVPDGTYDFVLTDDSADNVRVIKEGPVGDIVYEGTAAAKFSLYPTNSGDVPLTNVNGTSGALGTLTAKGHYTCPGP